MRILTSVLALIALTACATVSTSNNPQHKEQKQEIVKLKVKETICRPNGKIVIGESGLAPIKVEMECFMPTDKDKVYYSFSRSEMIFPEKDGIFQLPAYWNSWIIITDEGVHLVFAIDGETREPYKLSSGKEENSYTFEEWVDILTNLN